MVMDQSKPHKKQELKLFNRKLLELTGVLNVQSFDHAQFLLESELGHLSIQGSHLHMKHLSLENGIAVIEGHIQAISYVDPQSKQTSKSFLKKLLR